jgi:signal transduction histidine kinase
MRAKGFRQPILLFILTVVIPGLVLTAFTLRMIRQEKELVRTRMAEERQRIATAVGRTLLSRLEDLKSQTEKSLADSSGRGDRNSSPASEIELIAPIRGGELCLPWENPGSGHKEVPVSREYRAFIEAGERAEFKERNFLSAAAAFRRAAETETSPLLSASARLSLARALSKEGRISEAHEEFSHLLARPLDLTDEYGVPLAYFAAGRLLEFDGGPDEILTWLAGERIEDTWLSPTALAKLSDIVGALEADPGLSQKGGPLGQTIEALARARRRTNQALRLKSQFRTLSALLEEGAGGEKSFRWTAFGDAVWFVSMHRGGSADPSTLLGIKATPVWDAVLAAVRAVSPFPGACRPIFEEIPGTYPLNPAIAGVRVAFEEDDPSAWVRASFPSTGFYALALLLVFGVTGFGTYLLWRDVRRDYRSVELRSQFVSSVSHELKTPLTAIRMFAEALALRRPRAEAEKTVYLQTIVNESERLSRLINNVLDFSKIEQGTRTYRKEPVRLADIVTKAAQTMTYPLDQEGFRLQVSIAEGVPEIQGDKDALEQALLNLLHNAVKYSGKSRDVELRLLLQDGEAAIEVEDHGMGIGPEEKEKICDKYYRSGAAIDNRISGAGLGLSIVNHIVQAHGGRLEIESAVGNGSTFSIILPTGQAEKEP